MVSTFWKVNLSQSRKFYRHQQKLKGVKTAAGIQQLLIPMTDVPMFGEFRRNMRFV